MHKQKTNNDWRETFKKWYTGFAFTGLILTVVLRILTRFWPVWGEEMGNVIWAYFDVVFLLAFILLGIFIYFPRWHQNKKAKGDELGNIINKGTMKNKAKINLPPIECLGCGQPIKLPERITTIENYDGEITCKKCWALLKIEKVGNEIPRYKLVREGKGRPVQKVELNVVYDGNEKDPRLGSGKTQT
jgi:hypothetical protein